MTTGPRRRPWAFVLLGCLLACLTPDLSPSISAGSRTRCAALREWAAQYKDSTPTLDAFAAFDRSHRIAVFNAVTPTVRAALMREHLDRWVRQPGLTDDQRSLLAEAKDLLTPTLYSRRNGPESPTLKQFWSRAASTFPSSDDRRRWFDLGPSTERIRSPRATANAGEPPCECNAGHPWPQCSSTCTFGGCEPDNFGCGPLGWHSCNGLCD